MRTYFNSFIHNIQGKELIRAHTHTQTHTFVCALVLVNLILSANRVLLHTQTSKQTNKHNHTCVDCDGISYSHMNKYARVRARA